MAKKLKTMEEVLDYCRELRRQFEAHEAQFFLRLVAVEQQYGRFILDNGNLSFQRWLKDSAICDSSRYVNFRNGLAHVSHKEALRIGAPAVMALSAVLDVSKVQQYVTAVDAFRLTHGDTVPSLEKSKDLLLAVDPRPRVPRALKTVSRMAQLEAENQQLRADLRAARARIAQLEAELKKKRSSGTQAGANSKSASPEPQ